jgi:hypothetical protein
MKLAIGEPVIASESAYCLALLGNELESRMRSHRIPQVLQFAVDASFGQERFEGERVEKDV